MISMFNVQIDEDTSKSLFKTVVEKITDMLIPAIEARLKHDEIVNRAYLAKNVFHCGSDTISGIVNEPGFPYMYLGDNTKPSYSLKAVDEWIRKNQLK